MQLQTRVLLLLRILFVMALHAVAHEAVARGAVAHAVIVANASHARVAECFCAATQLFCFVVLCFFGILKSVIEFLWYVVFVKFRKVMC